MRRCIAGIEAGSYGRACENTRICLIWCHWEEELEVATGGGGDGGGRAKQLRMNSAEMREMASHGSW